MRVHVPRCPVALPRIVFAGLKKDFVKLKETGDLAVGKAFTDGRQFRKVIPILTGAELVENFAQAVDVRLSRSGTFWWDEPFRTDVGARFTDMGDQANISKFRNAADKND